MKYVIDENTLNAIANAIREKAGLPAEYKMYPVDMWDLISRLQTDDNIRLESITVKTKPRKTVYYLGEPFDPVGMKVTAQYSNGATRDVAFPLVCDQPPFTAEDAGSRNVAVKLVEFGAEAEAAVAVTVKNEAPHILPPANLRADVGTGGKLTLSWDPVAGAAAYALANDNVATSMPQNNQFTTYIYPGFQYTFSVCAVSEDGEFSAPAEITVAL